MFQRVLPSVLAVFCLGAAPAAASTMPSLDFSAGRHVFSLGLPDLSYDYALSDTRSVGIMATAFGTVAARTNVRLGGTSNGPNWGYTLGAGVAWLDQITFVNKPNPAERFNYDYTGWIHNGVAYWVSPALVGTFPVGIPGTSAQLVFRGAIGPGVFVGPDGTNGGFRYDTHIVIMPNLEVALRFNPQFELTVLGNSLFGLRAAF